VPTALRFLALTASTAAVYYFAATVEVVLAYPDPRRHTVWWAAGWGVSSVLLFGPRAAVGVFVGEWLGVLTNERASVWWLGAATGAANALEALLGAWLLRRAGLTKPPDTTRAVLKLAGAALVCPIALQPFQIPATWAAGWFAVSGAAGAAHALAQWWANDFVAVLFVVPLALAARDRAGTRAEVRGRYRELLALAAGLAAVTALSFGAPVGHWFAGLTVAAFPFLAWAGLRFGPRTMALALCVYAATIVVLTARRLDPFASLGADTFPFLHLLFGVISISALLLAAAVSERAAAESRAAEALRWEELGVLAGGLAHDLNNRLTAVMGNADLAAGEVPPDSPAAAHLAAVSAEAERLALLARDLLAYTGRGVLAYPRPTDVGAAAREAVAELGVRDRVPVTAAPGLVAVTDPALLRLAVRNLLLNATEAATGTGGGVAVAVTVEVVSPEFAARTRPLPGRAGPHARVRVSDSGRGMTPDVRHRMFDPFFSTKGAGRGLGLAGVLGAVRAAAGFVHVESEPDRGTTVDLYFPLAAA
jgi:signal transduction histidine kinase